MVKNTFLIITFIIGCQPQSEYQADLEDFASAFREANVSTSIEPMLALYELNGSTEKSITMLRNALLYEHRLPIENICFEPLNGSPEENIEYTHEGIKYGPSLNPLCKMRVRYATEDKFESLFTIGKNSRNKWRIVSSIPVRK